MLVPRTIAQTVISIVIAMGNSVEMIVMIANVRETASGIATEVEIARVIGIE
jgi:hypothetical protein